MLKYMKAILETIHWIKCKASAIGPEWPKILQALVFLVSCYLCCWDIGYKYASLIDMVTWHQTAIENSSTVFVKGGTLLHCLT